MKDLTEALEILKSGGPDGMSQEHRDKLVNGITKYLQAQTKLVEAKAELERTKIAGEKQLQEAQKRLTRTL